MTAHFPVTQAIGRDANVIMIALNSRSEQLKFDIDTQSLIKKITMTGLKILGLLSSVAAVASIPVTALMFAATPLTIGATALLLAVSCLALYMLLDPRSPGELIIKDQWKAVFEALRKGNGREILDTCQELAKQKEKRLSVFTQCLGSLPPDETTPFFHKICLIAYLQIALEALRHNDKEAAKSNAHLALSHFGSSGFEPEIQKFVQEILDSPKNMRHLMDTHQAGEDLHALDYLIAIR
ncbi:MAG TPA: hypothetical protein VGP47_02765 [Parachlamydiaceae bacterium]|nr:hypothetical protein [Parachlamydiaceae bacterium]